MLEVLAVDPDDERRQQEQRGNHRQLLHDLVLILRDLRLVVVAGARDQVAGDVERLDRMQQLVVGIREAELELPVEELVVADVDAAVHDPADRVASRPEGAADLEDVLSEIGEAASDARVRPALDSRLELVDLVVQGVEQLRYRSATSSTR